MSRAKRLDGRWVFSLQSHRDTTHIGQTEAVTANKYTQRKTSTCCLTFVAAIVNSILSDSNMSPYGNRLQVPTSGLLKCHHVSKLNSIEGAF